MKIILASKSPRRREILENIGLQFDVCESNVDETFDADLDPGDIVKYLSSKKAGYAAQHIKEDAIVIGADTIVVLGNDILGKPLDRDDAYKMLSSLSGKWHYVYSGICVIDTKTNKCMTDFEVTAVKIKELSNGEIISYIDTHEPLDKAGSYGIQGIGSLIVEKINGDYFNVVGLPVFKLSSLMENFGVNLLTFRG
jgi:septum formation protein